MPEIEAPEIELDEDAPRFGAGWRSSSCSSRCSVLPSRTCTSRTRTRRTTPPAKRRSRRSRASASRSTARPSTSSTTACSSSSSFSCAGRRWPSPASGRQTPSFSTVYGEDQWGESSSTRHDVQRRGHPDHRRTTTLNIAKSQVDPDIARLKQQVFASEANDYGNKADCVRRAADRARGRRVPHRPVVDRVRPWPVPARDTGHRDSGRLRRVGGVHHHRLDHQGLPTRHHTHRRGSAETDHAPVVTATPTAPTPIDNYKAAIATVPASDPRIARLSGAEFENGVNNSAREFESVSDTDADQASDRRRREGDLPR